MLTAFKKQFAYYRFLGEGAIAQLNEEELFRDDGVGSNSIAVIVKHLSGNMKSRWTDFMTTDGEKSWRNRDDEFIADFADREALETDWAAGWNVLETAIQNLHPDEMEDIVYIRNEGHTVTEAMLRQLAHYTYHVGQIVLLGKQMKGEDWVSLSIPKNESSAFNKGKFTQSKGLRHFTDGLMKDVREKD